MLAAERLHCKQLITVRLYMLSSCVRLSQVKVIQRRLNLGSHQKRHTQGRLFSDAKNLGEFTMGAPNRGGVG